MSEVTRPTTAVLVMGFGGPESLDAVEPFMTNLMGREPSKELLDSVKRRYLTIGGTSPLPGIAHSIAQALERKLGESETPVPVAIGMRYWHPYIADTLRGMYASGVRRVIAVSLSPFDTAVSTGAYRQAIDEVRSEHPDLEVVEAPSIGTMPGFGVYLASAAASALTSLSEAKPILTIFTAHSLPLDGSEECDSYVVELSRAIDAMVGALGMPIGMDIDGSDEMLRGVTGYGTLKDPQPWILAFQSRGERSCGWLGPDLDEVIDAAVEGGFKGIAVCPVGFATDHMETLYDLDVVTAERVLDRGVDFARAPVPNDDELLVGAIAEAVEPLLTPGSESQES